MNGGFNVPPPSTMQMIPIALKDPESLKTGLDELERRLIQVKLNMEELLLSLDAQDKVSWPNFVLKCSALALEFSTIQEKLRTSCLSQNVDDAMRHYLKSQLIIPHTISPEHNENLARLTEGRVQYWNHEAAPSFLRTKLGPDIENDNIAVDPEMNQKTLEMIQKQITVMNKHIDTLCNNISDTARSNDRSAPPKTAFNNQTTDVLVKAMILGDGIAKKGR